MLNDLFDPVRRGITIIETEHSTGVTLHLRADGQELTTPQILNTRGFGGSTDLDFAVRLPGRLAGAVDERQVNSMVRRYKLAGMRFGLEYVGVRTVDFTIPREVTVAFQDRQYGHSIAILTEHHQIQ